jgi:hypothetical protein
MHRFLLPLVVVAGCSSPETQISLQVHASTLPGTSADAITVELGFRSSVRRNGDWQENDVVPVLADCTVSADGDVVVEKVDASSWDATFVGWPEQLDVRVVESGGPSHQATFRLPSLFSVQLSPAQPTSGEMRVDWSPSGDDAVSVAIELVHRDDGHESWSVGEVDDGTATLPVAGPLNFVDVARTRSVSNGSIELGATLHVSTPARPPSSVGQDCDSDDDCAPLVCDWVTDQCVALGPAGAPCNFDHQCASGSCAWPNHGCE